MENSQLKVNTNKYTLIQVINRLGITNKKDFLTKEEFTKIYLMYNADIGFSEYTLNINIEGYKKTVETFKTIEEWEKAEFKDKIIYRKNSYSNYLYYYVMILAGRIDIDVNIMNQKYFKLPVILEDNEKMQIVSAANKLGFKKEYRELFCIFNKFIFFCRKPLNLINKADYDKFCKEYYYNFNIYKGKKIIFEILRYLGNIKIELTYKQINTRNKCIDYVETNHKQIAKIYYQFKEEVYNVEYGVTAYYKALIAKKFIEWLNKNYEYFDDLHNLDYFEHIEPFICYLKHRKKNKKYYYSMETTNGLISRFKQGFLKYLTLKNILNEDNQVYIFSYDSEYDSLSYSKTENLPKPVPIEDRLKIEESIMKEYEDIDELIMDIIRLCYFIGARPSEVLALRSTCLKGIQEVPSVHIHRAKFFKERYIPLVSEAYKIIKKWSEINKASLPVYLEYDKDTCKRLFQKQGKVYALRTIEQRFSDIMVRNNIIDIDNHAKYSLYILRKIRISIWFENKLSEEEIAYLAGHEDVDVQGHYIISKELRRENIKKVYNKYYKDILGKSVKVQNRNESVSEIQELENEIREIEKKGVNKVVKEKLIKEFKDYIIPLPCGNCLAKAFDDRFECELMNLPCLSCEKLIPNIYSRKKLDDFVKRLYISRKEKKKLKLDGIVMKIDYQISKIKQFYIEKFIIDESKVKEIFYNIEISVTKRRGRPKKESVNYE